MVTNGKYRYAVAVTHLAKLIEEVAYPRGKEYDGTRGGK